MKLACLGTFVTLVASASVWATTLEQLTIEQMAQRSTSIVRAKVLSCNGEVRRATIHTRCRASVSEQWKGTPVTSVDLFVPGGTAGGLRQEVAGSPRLETGEEYVLFLWAGRSGRLQVIGLTQGVFEFRATASGSMLVREATHEPMVDAGGNLVKDANLVMTLADLRARVQRALRGGATQ